MEMYLRTMFFLLMAHCLFSLIFTLPMVLGLLIFYAFCLQCVATLAVIRRETNSVALPLLAWIYMTSLGYLGAFIVYQIGINYV